VCGVAGLTIPASLRLPETPSGDPAPERGSVESSGAGKMYCQPIRFWERGANCFGAGGSVAPESKDVKDSKDIKDKNRTADP